ncbi:hypothetical protein [Dactylosporangium salmoneum]
MTGVVPRVLVFLPAIALIAAASACGGAAESGEPAPSRIAETTNTVTKPTGDVAQTPDDTETPPPPPTTEAARPTLSIPGTFRSQSIISLDGGATSSERRQIADAMWDFHSGEFTFDTTGVTDHLFPLHGTYSDSGTKVSFRAENSFSAGAGLNSYVRVEGTLDLTTAVVAFTKTGGQVSAGNIDNQQQGSNGSSVLDGQVRIGRGEKIPPRYTGPEPGSYPVTITGTVAGVRFSRDATVTVAKSAGGNPIDVCLISGFPPGAPQLGAIRFGSNTVCSPGAANTFDMGRATVSGSTIVVQADPLMTSTQMNNFTSSNSLFACLYGVQSGSMKVTVTNGSASGSIDVTSGSCGGARYQAQISG